MIAVLECRSHAPKNETTAVPQFAKHAHTGGNGTFALSDQAYFAGGTQETLKPYEGHIFYSPSKTNLFNPTRLDVSPLTVTVNLRAPRCC